MSDETPLSAIEQKIVRERDPQQLAEFITTQRSQLSGFVRSITGDRLLAVVELDDLVQEIATSALAGLGTAPLDQYSPWQWLQQIARRRVVDAHRFHFEAKRRDASRQQSMHGGDDQSGGGIEALLAASITSPSAVLSRDVRLSRLKTAIDALPDDQRQAITLRYVDGLATKQIAEQLGKTDVAVRVMLSRSVRELEKQLADVKPTR